MIWEEKTHFNVFVLAAQNIWILLQKYCIAPNFVWSQKYKKIVLTLFPSQKVCEHQKNTEV